MSNTMSIQQSIPARPFRMGNMSIFRVLPHLHRRMVGPFIFMDQGGPLTVQKMSFNGVPEHPHAGLSTFTYLIQGAVHHQDSAGFSSDVHSGDIALMTAGSGLSHEEKPLFEEGTTEHTMYFAQMWLALPDEVEDMPPTFEHHPATSVPVLKHEKVTVRIAMGTLWGTEAPTTCYAPTFFADIEMQALGTLTLENTYQEQALFIIEGSASLDGVSLDKHTLYVLNSDQHTVLSKTGCRALYFGGDTFPTERFIGGSFVASSKEKLQYWIQQSQTPYWPKIQRES